MRARCGPGGTESSRGHGRRPAWCSAVLLASGFLVVRVEAAATEPACSGRLVRVAPPTACGWRRPVCISGDSVPAGEEDARAAGPSVCGWWRQVCISSDGVPAEEKDVGPAAPGVRAFSSLLRRELCVWRGATRREVLLCRCGPPRWCW
jgi:hypothetical protein